MPAIKVHHTHTTDTSWDASVQKRNLKVDQDPAYYEEAYAERLPETDGKNKSDFDFIHHMVSADGTVGSANLTACSNAIGVLNGGRGGTTIPKEDIQGVYDHLAAHLKDAGKEAPPLKASAEAGHAVERFAAPFAPQTVNESDRIVDVVWYTGKAVPRADFWSGDGYDLTLSLKPADVRLDRLNSGAALLDDHNDFGILNQIGVVLKAWVDAGVARATVQFSKRDDVTPIWEDVRAGILRNLSFGAWIYNKIETTAKDARRKSFLANDWEPFEVSLVPVPADADTAFLSAKGRRPISPSEQIDLAAARKRELDILKLR